MSAELTEFHSASHQHAEPISPTGRLSGGQAFGPHGGRMAGAPGGAPLPWGHAPATGCTGHLAEDAAGLVCMRGRCYSPLWHRFASSDRGADPGGPNQHAYAGGAPFSATDPSGMMMWCNVLTVQHYQKIWGDWILTGTDVTVLGCWDDGAGEGEAEVDDKKTVEMPDQCKKLKELGVTKEQYARMKENYGATAQDQSLFNRMDTPRGLSFDYSGGGGTVYEHGFAYSGGQYISGTPSMLYMGTNSNAYMYGGIDFNLPDDATGLTFHTHINVPGAYFVGVRSTRKGYLQPQLISKDDINLASHLMDMIHMAGWEGGLMQYNQNGLVQNVGGPNWWDTDCSKWLKSDKDK